MILGVAGTCFTLKKYNSVCLSALEASAASVLVCSARPGEGLSRGTTQSHKYDSTLARRYFNVVWVLQYYLQPCPRRCALARSVRRRKSRHLVHLLDVAASAAGDMCLHEIWLPNSPSLAGKTIQRNTHGTSTSSVPVYSCYVANVLLNT